MRQALVKAEVKLFQAGRALAGKKSKSRPVASRGARHSNKSKAAVRKPQPDSPRASQAPVRVAGKKPATEKTNVVAENPAEVAALDPTPSTPPTPGSNL